MMDLEKLAQRAEEEIAPQFARLERISRENTGKILDSFRQHRVCEGHFAPSTALCLTAWR